MASAGRQLWSAMQLEVSMVNGQLIALALCMSEGLTAVGAPEQEPPPLWFDLQPGAYKPAFTVTYVVDEARSWCAEADADCRVSGRPVRVFIWRPAERVYGEPMRLGALLDIDPEDPRFQSYDDLVDRRAQDTFSRQFFGEDRERLVERLRSESTWSFRDAEPAAGRFPLVLHSLGRNDYQLESTVLWEYLASHGFVVAVIPQIGSGPAQDRLAFSLEDLQVQAQDLAFVARHIRADSYVEHGRYGVIGHSSGAVAAFLMAEGEPDLAALVSLDGSISTEDGRSLLEASGWGSNRVRAALLNIHVAEKNGLDFWAIEQAHGLNRYNVAVVDAIHFDFQNWPLYNALYDVAESRSAAVRSKARARDVFLATVQLTKQFLQGVLTDDRSALDRLNNGLLPRGFAGDLADFKYQASQ